VPTAHCTLFKGIEDRRNAEGHGLLDVWMSHGDKVTALPPGFKVIGSNASTPIAAMADEARRFYAVQFHPEVTHTLKGREIIGRFVRDICGCGHDWNMPDYVTEAIEKIRSQVGNEEVILGLSGGVDSSVAAALIHRAIGEQLTCVFVDNGLLRLNEAEQVMQTFARNLGVKVVHVDAAAQFMGQLQGVSDPEEKRKIIGREFVEVFQVEAARLSNAKWLAQGTIYPDVIESAGAKTRKAHTIKSHHNVGGLPEQLNLWLLEPLRELFKDEVRELGIALGLPHDMVYRHPFPGPGLGVRILGEVKPEFAELLRRADAIFIDELRASGWYEKTSQAFAVFLPVKSVGVMGRRPDVRIRRRPARGGNSGLHDCALGGTAAQPARKGFQPDHQRGAWHQPGGLRHLGQAAGNDRVGNDHPSGNGRKQLAIRDLNLLFISSFLFFVWQQLAASGIIKRDLLMVREMV
jgi:GMP synthase (glutamine-hydrolysing)